MWRMITNAAAAAQHLALGASPELPEDELRIGTALRATAAAKFAGPGRADVNFS
jgi:hypothetical protein